MPTARHSPGVLSLQSSLVVAGGGILSSPYYTATVEIFKRDMSQWCRTDPLPRACRDMSLVCIGDICYALGGHTGISLNEALHASIDDLLGKAVPPYQSTSTWSAWKTLPNMPTYAPAAAVLAGNLLAIGGKVKTLGADRKEVYTYSPSANSWICLGDLPVPRSLTAVSAISFMEILIIGGSNGGLAVNTVYMGTLLLNI